MDIERIIIDRRIIDEFLDRVKGSRVEVGGILLGRRIDGSIYVERLLIGRNILDSPVRFELDDETIAEAIKAEDEGYEIVGIIHSHPAPAIPSSIDRLYMDYWPIPWIIVDSNTLDIGAWNRDRRIELVIKD